MSSIPDSLRKLIRERAANACEYCRLPEVFFALHEPDHIIAEQHRGSTTAENLALACFDWNRFKGPNIASVDPDSGAIVSLFNPRTDLWSEHFQIEGDRILGKTPKGRATVELLRFNDAIRIRLRSELQRIGRFPKS